MHLCACVSLERYFLYSVAASVPDTLSLLRLTWGERETERETGGLSTGGEGEG